MTVKAALLAEQTILFEFDRYYRVFPAQHSATPLGCAPGWSRFGASDKSFSVIYAARNFATAIAEGVIRDRFEGLSERRLHLSELHGHVVGRLQTLAPLRVVDLRKGGCLKLGISTDIAGAKAFDLAQAFSHEVYSHAEIDGILYPSRLTGENCVAIYERAIGTHLEAGLVNPLVQVPSLAASLTSLKIRLLR